MIKKWVDKIPEEYRQGFFEQEVAFIRSRVQLLCVLTIVIYFFTAVIDVLINPNDPILIELGTGFILIAGGAFTLFLNRRAKTLFMAKLNAYMFVLILLTLVVKLGTDYAYDPAISSSVYVFILFLVSIVIPWRKIEVVPIWLFHLAGFSMEFVYCKNMPGAMAGWYSHRQYLDGILFVTLAFIICLVVRNKETTRDIENFILLKKVEDKNAQMDKELKWATRIHKTIIPKSLSSDRIDIGVSYLPAYYIGGDYVKYEFLGDHRILFIISDVTGHGIPSALLVNRVHAEFERYAKDEKEPGELLESLNVFIKEDFEGADMYLTAFCGMIDFGKMELSYSNHGHPPQYLYNIKDGCIKSLPAQTSMLGLPMEDSEIYQNCVDINKDDRLLLFTDGVTEAVDENGEEYGYFRLESFLNKNHSIGVDEFDKKLLEELKLFTGGKFEDDVCIMNLLIKQHKSILGIGDKIFKHKA